MSPMAITLLMLAGLAGFGALAWRKLALLPRLAPEVRWDHPVARLAAVLVNGLLQRRMIAREPAAGVMHAVIFLGFVALLARKLQLIVIGYDELFVYPGLAGGLFAAAKDAVELAVLAALAYAFWRRYVLRPRRLEPNREALLVLSLIVVIMLTDLAYDGFRFALWSARDGGIAHERSFAFAGDAIASQLAAWPPPLLEAGCRLAYWTQMLTVFAFLVILPTGEHFHIVTALPALFLHRGRPAHQVSAVDLRALMDDGADAGDPAALRVGVRTARELSWKDAFDAFTCTECGRCKTACPTFLTGKPLAQKWVHDGIKKHLLAQRQTLLAGAPAAGEDDPLPPLVGGVISEDALWACTSCGYCEAACPIELEHLPKFFRLRQQRVLMEGEFPHELKPVFEAWESQSNPWGLPAQTRADWAGDLDLPRWTRASQAADFDVLYYVGSAASFDARGRKIARAFVRVLQAAGVRLAILGEAETSTGECARRLGNEMLFQTLAGALVQTLNTLGVKRIVTTDPHAFNSLKNEYPAFGGHWQVEHHSQLIARLLAEGRLPVETAASPAVPPGTRIVFHDPCYLGRHNDEYAAPRRVIRLVAGGAALDEFELHGPQAMCCGAGGGRMWMEERIGSRINVLRTEQALARAPQVIATACPYCALMLDDGLKALDRAGEVVVKDIAELVAQALGPVPPRPLPRQPVAPALPTA